MFGSLLRRVAQKPFQIAFAILVLLSAQAQAQDLVGSWMEPRFRITLQANGRWLLTVTDPTVGVECGGSASAGGSYTASGGSISMSVDSATCGSRSEVAPPQFFASGSYSISGSTLSAHLQGTDVWADVTLTAIGGTTTGGSIIPPDTPLPPPQIVQSVYTAPNGQMPTAAVSVSPSGTFGNATLVVTLDLSKVLSGGSFAAQGQFAAGYNIYVVALVPSGALGLPSATWFMYPASRAWAALGSPIAAYLEGLAQNATNTVEINILQDMDVTGLVGTEIYIGYGTGDTEMLASGRYRGVYKVQ